jgi:hypothetical protein
MAVNQYPDYTPYTSRHDIDTPHAPWADGLMGVKVGVLTGVRVAHGQWRTRG